MSSLLLSLQLVLGGVFAVSAFLKLKAPRSFVEGVEDYKILPQWLVSPFAYLALVTEILTAISLLSQRYTSIGALTATSILFVYSVAIWVNLFRRSTIDCHCFKGVTDGQLSWVILIRAILLMAGASLALLHSMPTNAISSDTVNWVHVLVFTFLQLLVLGLVELTQQALTIAGKVRAQYTREAIR